LIALVNAVENPLNDAPVGGSVYVRAHRQENGIAIEVPDSAVVAVCLKRAILNL
jgi:hypothetical protein